MNAMEDMIWKIKAKDITVGESVSCWLPTAKKLGSIRQEKILCKHCMIGCGNEKEGSSEKMEEVHQ